MIIRIIDLFIVLALGGGGIWYILKTYVYDPRKKAQAELASTTDTAIEKAEVDYREIRKAWVNFALQEKEDMFASYMSDMSIPEVSKFQKLMVSMNERYRGLTQGEETDAVFVQKAVALRALFDDAVLEAKKKSL